MEREQIGSPCPVVDYELVPSFAGGSEEMGVWCICRTEKEKTLFRDTEYARYVSALKKKMMAAGFSEAAVASLTARVTSREEIEAGGGRLHFFH
jgi:hypothetical protein